jgi:hypothetical protein
MLDSILNILYSFLQFLINIFPVGTGFSTGFHTAMTSLGAYLHILDPIIPINILLTCLLFIFGVEIAIFGFKTLKWIISHIPWIGGHGNQT